MRKKVVRSALAVLLTLAFSLPIFAQSDKVVTIGANLNEQEISTVYEHFGIKRGDVHEITVSNSDVREMLEGNVPESALGTKSYSSTYIEPLDEGKGLNIKTQNVTWCTKDMYQNALQTAGIFDANVIITAPFEVTGTTALTGIFMAYEESTGETLSEDAKRAAMKEMITTGELVEDLLGQVSEEDIIYLINQLKVGIDQLKSMSDDEVRQEIRSIATSIDITLTDAHVEKLLSLVRSLQGINLDVWQERISSFVSRVQNEEGFFAKIWSGFLNILDTIGAFLKSIFS